MRPNHCGAVVQNAGPNVEATHTHRAQFCTPVGVRGAPSRGRNSVARVTSFATAILLAPTEALGRIPCRRGRGPI